MGLHQRHTHGRVFHGEDAREQLKIRKRDSHGDSIRLHVPEGFQAKQVENDEPQQAASVVYVTLSQTFEGPAMYSTLTGDYNPEVTEAPQTTARNGAPDFFTGEAGSSTRRTRTTADEEAVETSTVVPQSSNRAAQATTLATTTSAGASYMAGTPIQATRAATSTAVSAESQDNGMSAGGKAGLAIGIIAAFGLIAVIALLVLKRRKRAMKGEALNEKHGSFADVGARRAEADGSAGGMSGGMSGGMPVVAAGAVGAAGAGATVANKRDSSMTEKVPSSLRSTRTASTAPRLSLRPVTQFLPMLGDNKSNGTVNSNEQRNSDRERTPANNGTDPFADGPTDSEKQANPFDEQRRSNESLNGAVAAAGGTAAAAAAAAHASGHEGGEGSRSAPVAAGAGGVPPPRQPNNVHRVQLDFKPSMDDELELISGALVRLLHEYDDGWALCITMDRSKQGVAPRTCLSKLPVKPRPQGPPPPQGSQGYRPGPPNGTPRGPPPQGGNRPAPNGAPGAMQPRPLTPQSTRTPSPTEQQRPTEQPRTSGSTSTSPAGSQVPKRKPVGQAM